MRQRDKIKLNMINNNLYFNMGAYIPQSLRPQRNIRRKKDPFLRIIITIYIQPKTFVDGIENIVCVPAVAA